MRPFIFTCPREVLDLFFEDMRPTRLDPAHSLVKATEDRRLPLGTWPGRTATVHHQRMRSMVESAERDDGPAAMARPPTPQSWADLDVPTPLWQPTDLACATVCKQFKDIIEPLVYEVLHVHAGSESRSTGISGTTQLMAGWGSGEPWAAGRQNAIMLHTREINIHPSTCRTTTAHELRKIIDQIKQLLQCAVNVQAINIHHDTMAFISLPPICLPVKTPFRSLTSIVNLSVLFETLETFAELVRLIGPQLRTLVFSISQGWFGEEEVRMEAMQAWPSVLRRLTSGGGPRLPVLATLGVKAFLPASHARGCKQAPTREGWAERTFEGMVHWLASGQDGLPTLRRLSLLVENDGPYKPPSTTLSSSLLGVFARMCPDLVEVSLSGAIVKGVSDSTWEALGRVERCSVPSEWVWVLECWMPALVSLGVWLGPSTEEDASRAGGRDYPSVERVRETHPALREVFWIGVDNGYDPGQRLAAWVRQWDKAAGVEVKRTRWIIRAPLPPSPVVPFSPFSP